MPAQLFSNNADSSLAVGISAAATSITISAGDGNKFPLPAAGDYFLCTLFTVSGTAEASWEIVKCTARVGDVLTVVRGQEGTPARSFSSADRVSLRWTAGSAANYMQGGNNLSEITSQPTARTNLGLGSAATTPSTAYATAAQGAAADAALPRAGGTMTGDLVFSGPRRITGDLSNGTRASRLLVQSSSGNSTSSLGVAPSGTGNIGELVAYGGSDPDNASSILLRTDAPAALNSLRWTKLGTGVVYPMAFFNDATEAFRISPASRMLIGTAVDDTLNRLQVNGSVSLTNNLQLIGTGGSTVPALSTGLVSGELNSANSLTSDLGLLRLSAGGRTTVAQKTAIDIFGSASLPDRNSIRFYTNGAEKARFSLAGNLLLNKTLDDLLIPLQVAGSASIDGNLTIIGAGRRIQAAFGGSPASTGVFFQTSAVNAATYFPIMPNGSSLISSIQCFGSSSPDNASIASLHVDQGTGLARIDSGQTGTGVALPFVVSILGAEAMRVHTSRRVSVGTTVDDGNSQLQVIGGMKVQTTGLVNTLRVVDTGGSGVGLYLQGNGAVTPSKTIRVYAGNFELLNNAGGAVILQVTDTGQLGIVTGGLLHLNNERVFAARTITFNQEYDNGPSGAGVVIDFANGQDQRVTLTAPTTLNISINPPGVGHYQLKLIQNAAGGNNIAWYSPAYSPSRWLGSATAPVPLLGANQITIVSLYWDGNLWFQSMSHVGAV